MLHKHSQYNSGPIVYLYKIIIKSLVLVKDTAVDSSVSDRDSSQSFTCCDLLMWAETQHELQWKKDIPLFWARVRQLNQMVGILCILSLSLEHVWKDSGSQWGSSSRLSFIIQELGSQRNHAGPLNFRWDMNFFIRTGASMTKKKKTKAKDARLSLLEPTKDRLALRLERQRELLCADINMPHTHRG